MAKINATLFSQRQNVECQQPCPDCGGATVIKHGKYGPFKSCSNYPNCLFMQALNHNDGHVIKALGIACPECGDELALRQGRFGMFIGCLAYPACQHVEKREQETELEADLINCPKCKVGKILEKHSRFGKRFYACDGYPKCKLALNSKPVAGQCSVCHYPLLLEKHSMQGTSLQCANKQCAHMQSK